MRHGAITGHRQRALSSTGQQQSRNAIRSMSRHPNDDAAPTPTRNEPSTLAELLAGRPRRGCPIYGPLLSMLWNSASRAQVTSCALWREPDWFRSLDSSSPISSPTISLCART